MSKEAKNSPVRKPAAFKIEDDEPPVNAAAKDVKPQRTPRTFSDNVILVDEADDPFFGDLPQAELEVAIAAVPKRRGFSWGKLAVSALGVIISLSVGLWIDRLVVDLFSQSDLLGYLALAATAVLILAILAIAMGEMWAMRRLAAVRHVRAEAELARNDPRPGPARAVVARLASLTASRAETARGRDVLARTEGEIIDGPGLIRLAETELMTPLDAKARMLVLSASRRVSIVTAVSPRALVDVFYVVYESARLIRAIADLYGARPGRLGFFKLFRDVISHLAVTGSIAVGDSLMQQFIGHGLASKLSARFGEGVINGLMTARIGISAIDLCRPMAFHAVKRPGIGDFLSDIAGSAKK